MTENETFLVSISLNICRVYAKEQKVVKPILMFSPLSGRPHASRMFILLLMGYFFLLTCFFIDDTGETLDSSASSQNDDDSEKRFRERIKSVAQKKLKNQGRVA